MAKFQGPFYHIDQFTFKQIDNLMSNSNYQRFHEHIVSLGETKQKMVNYIATTLALLLPIILVISLSYQNSQTRTDLEIRNQILKSINNYKNKQSEAAILGRSIVSPYSVKTQEDFEKRVNKAASRKNIDHKNISLSAFDQASGEIITSTANLSFEQLTTSKFTGLLSSLIRNEKLKIAQLKVLRDKNSKLLSGKLSLIHYGK